MSRRFRSACAQGADWQAATRACLDQILPAGDAVFGLLYVTEAMAPHLEEVVTLLRSETDIALWSGCVGAGICGPGWEAHDGFALSVLLGAVPEHCVAALPSLRQPEDAADVAPEDWDVRNRPVIGLVHGDPRNGAVPEIVSLLPETLDGYLIGGLGAAPGGPAQVSGGTVTGGGLSGLLLSASVPVAVGLSQGCRPLGPVHQVTGMDGDWLTGLDGRPALDVLKEDLGHEAAARLKDLGGVVHGAVPVEGSDTGDYLVRGLMAVDPGEGRLGLAADLIEGDRLMFVRRDPAAAEDDLRRMIRGLLGRLGDRAAHLRGAVYVSCRARGPHMFGGPHGDGPGEMDILHQELGALPLTGFFALGEINNNRLYTYTGVLTLFL